MTEFRYDALPGRVVFGAGVARTGSGTSWPGWAPTASCCA
jgi:hypothetical protein